MALSPKDYPAFLESYWLRRARAVTGLADNEAALEKLRPAVQALSDLFTTERPGGDFPDYAADPAKRIGYGLFFFPQSYVKCALAIDPALKRLGWSPGRTGEPIRILDIGSASGPCGLAAALALSERTGRRVVLTALDKSSDALGELRDMVSAIPEISGKIAVETKIGDLRRLDDFLRELPPQDLITVGFAANEVFGRSKTDARLAWAESLGARLSDDGLLVILEPALRETAEPLRKLRDAALAGPNLFAVGPDVAPTPCPMIASDAKFWDHEVRTWTSPDSLEFLNRKLHRDTRVLKFTAITLGKKPPGEPEGAKIMMRIVSPFESQKGGFVFSAITQEGVLVKVDIPARGLSKNDCKRYASSWERGDIAGCEAWSALSNPRHYRVSGPEALAKIYSP